VTFAHPISKGVHNMANSRKSDGTKAKKLINIGLFLFHIISADHEPINLSKKIKSGRN
jgi:hypothetical protein